MNLKRLESFFTALFTIERAVDRPLYRCVYRGARMCGCKDTTVSIGDHRKSLCVPIVRIKGLIKVVYSFRFLTGNSYSKIKKLVPVVERQQK